MDKVIIVRAGEYGKHSAEAGSYDGLIRKLRRVAELLSQKKEDYKKIEVQVVKSVEQAKEAAMEMPLNYSFVVVFLTRGLIERAKNLRRELTAVGRKGKVVLLTGLFPEEDEIIILEKTWLIGGSDLFKDAIMP